jgi:hypothetical protein
MSIQQIGGATTKEVTIDEQRYAARGDVARRSHYVWPSKPHDAGYPQALSGSRRDVCCSSAPERIEPLLGPAASAEPLTAIASAAERS